MDTKVYASSAKIYNWYSFLQFSWEYRLKECMDHGDLESHDKLSSFVIVF